MENNKQYSKFLQLYIYCKRVHGHICLFLKILKLLLNFLSREIRFDILFINILNLTIAKRIILNIIFDFIRLLCILNVNDKIIKINDFENFVIQNPSTIWF